MDSVIDFNAVRLAAAVLFFLTSVTVWIVLFRQHDKVAVGLWALGGLGFSVAMLARVDSEIEVRSAFYVVSGSAASMGFVLRALAMRRDLGLKTRGSSVMGICALIAMPLAVLAAWASASSAVLFARASGAILLAVMAVYSWQLGRRLPSRNGLILSGVEALTFAAYLLVITQLLLNWQDGLAMKRWDYAVFSVVAVINAAYSNLAYAGLVLDRSRVAERKARDAQVAEVTRRELAEQSAYELRLMLLQRDRLAAERGHLLQVLAHEIRQPLHNANAALQGAVDALAKPPVTNFLPKRQLPAERVVVDQTALSPDAVSDAGATADAVDIAAERVLRAQAVLGDMQSVLDNTLAVSNLLVREAALTVQEVEIDFLLDLALGDLPEAERAQVVLQRQSELRSIDVEPGLVRLALRNLLRNAFRHGGPDARVSLRIEEQLDPPALLLSVCDTGPGLTESQWRAVLPAPAEEAGTGAEAVAPLAAAQPTTPQSGVGFFLVRRVMALHGGRLQLHGIQPQGLQASLLFPLPLDE